MRNACIQILLAANREPGPLIESDRMSLRRERNLQPSARAAAVYRGLQYRLPNALAAPVFQYSHAAYGAAGQDAGTADRVHVPTQCQQVHRCCIKAIPFQFWRHLLLVHEYLFPYLPERILGLQPTDFLNRKHLLGLFFCLLFGLICRLLQRSANILGLIQCLALACCQFRGLMRIGRACGKQR